MSNEWRVTAVARHLGAASGVPFIRAERRTVFAPDPYSVTVYTGRFGERHRDSLRSLPTVGVPMHIHYSDWMDSVGDAIVSMRLSDFAPLLGAHYEAHVAGRSE